MKKIINKFIFTSIFIEIICAQYLNPYFGGAGNSGYGESGAHLSGPIYGIYNPASLYINYPRVNQSVTTGQFSDFLLLYPTIKDLSISYPVIANSLFLRAYYGKPINNDLRYKYGPDWLRNPQKYYKGGEQHLGLSLAYKIPMSQLFTRGNFFDIRLGVDIAEYWGTIIFNSRNSDDELNNFWLRSFHENYGLSAKIGTLVKFQRSIKYQWTLGTVISSKYPAQTRDIEFDIYSISFGLKRISHRKSIQTGIEAENIFTNYKRKIGVGLQYNFTNYPINSIQMGLYQYPKNTQNDIYRNQPAYWYTIGFTRSIKDWIISASISDELNLNLSRKTPPSSDISKIISISLSIPFKNKKLQMKKNKDVYPEFLDLSIRKREIVIGKEDTLQFYLKLFGKDSLSHPRVFFNVEPKKGIIINTPYIALPTMHHLDMYEVDVPITAVSGLSAGSYDIAASLTYGIDQVLVKNFQINTVNPQIDVVSEFGSETRYILFPVPGSYIMTLKFTNFGNYKSDSLAIDLSDEFSKYGLIENTHFVVKDIKPNTSKSLKINLNSVSDTLPPRIPVTFRFTESNGFDPLPIHSEIVIIDKNRISINQIENDPFLNNFSNFQEFYYVIRPDWDVVKSITKNTNLELNENPKFPGKLVFGPYSQLDVALAYEQTISSYVSGYEIVAVNDNQTIPIVRYFFSVSKTNDIKRKLEELDITFVHIDRQNPSLLLIGPFINLKTILELKDFINEFFPDAEVVSRYPNQVTD